MNIFRRIKIECQFKKLIKQPICDSTTLLIKNTLQLFPCTIDFSDGELLNDNGFFSSNLSKVWNNAEKQNTSKDENIDFMIWSIYGVLHKKCRHLFNSGIYSLNVNELDYNEINIEYIQNCLEADIPINMSTK